jgi:hypothetical protein
MRSLRLQALLALGLCVGIGSVAEATVYEVNAGAVCPGSGTPGSVLLDRAGRRRGGTGRHRERGRASTASR